MNDIIAEMRAEASNALGYNDDYYAALIDKWADALETLNNQKETTQ